MNWVFIRDYFPLYVDAMKVTLNLGVTGILGAFGLGFIVSLVRHHHLPILSQLARFYIELSRNTPLLIQLYFIYFGLPKVGVVFSSELSAIIGLIFLGGSYMAESFRSGLESIDKIQYDSAFSIGLSQYQTIRYIVLPQALANALPSFAANVIFLIKETSVFSIIALTDLMAVAKDLIGLYYETDEALLLLVVSYLAILLPLSLLFSYLERRLRHATFGPTRPISGS